MQKQISFKKKSFPDHRRILSNELTQVEKLTPTNDVVPILSSQLAVGKKIDLSIFKFPV